MKNYKVKEFYHDTAHELRGKDVIKEYILGGYATVTLTSPTKVHHTYHVRRRKSPYTNNYAVYGMRRNKSWGYLGNICQDRFSLTPKSELPYEHPVVKGIVYILKMMQKDFDTPMVLQHEGCCGVCGRRLTDPKSIERGIGPTCYRIHGT